MLVVKMDTAVAFREDLPLRRGCPWPPSPCHVDTHQHPLSEFQCLVRDQQHTPDTVIQPI